MWAAEGETGGRFQSAEGGPEGLSWHEQQNSLGKGAVSGRLLQVDSSEVTAQCTRANPEFCKTGFCLVPFCVPSRA